MLALILRPIAALLVAIVNAVRNLFARPRPHPAVDDEEVDDRPEEA